MFFGKNHHHRHGAPRHGGRHGGGFGGSWDIEGEGPRGRRRMFDSGELRLVLLKLIAEAPRHGYDLIREIEERTGGAYAPSPGVVYPTLTMLADMEHVEEQHAGGARKIFAITDAGTAHLAEHAKEVEALLARLAELGSMRARTRGGPIKRAMMNMRTVLQHKLGEEADADTLHAVAAIIDEAAQKIERL
jgi:DNA-binding PadR family transcriptional regulator